MSDVDDLRRAIGERIRLVRLALGKPRTVFCDETGASSQQLSPWKTGDNFPDEAFIVALWEQYNVSADYIYLDRLA